MINQSMTYKPRTSYHKDKLAKVFSETTARKPLKVLIQERREKMINELENTSMQREPPLAEGADQLLKAAMNECLEIGLHRAKCSVGRHEQNSKQWNELQTIKRKIEIRTKVMEVRKLLKQSRRAWRSYAVKYPATLNELKTK